ASRSPRSVQSFSSSGRVSSPAGRGSRFWVLRSQKRTELSSLPEARNLPSGEKAQHKTRASLQVNCPVSRPPIGSAKATERPSPPPPSASCLPSGEKIIPFPPSHWHTSLPLASSTTR